jgi:DNA polymerase-3 subunit delta'
VVTVPLLDDGDIEAHLQEHYQLDAVRASVITALAEGDLNYAIKLLDGEADDSSHQFTQWMRACFRKSYLSMVQLAEDFHSLDKLSQKNRLKYGIHAMREALLYTSGAHTMVRSQGEESKFLQDFSKVLDLDKIEKSFTLMNDASYHLERNGSAKMIFLDLSLNLAKTINP